MGADLITLSETWLKPRVPNRLVTFSGYQLIRADRVDGLGFGGVAILARDGYKLTALPKPESNNPTTKLETAWARLTVGRDRGIVICAMYRAPSAAGAQASADPRPRAAGAQDTAPSRAPRSAGLDQRLEL